MVISTIPSKHINSKYDGFVGGKSLYEKLWEHLGKREKLDLRSTKYFVDFQVSNFPLEKRAMTMQYN